MAFLDRDRNCSKENVMRNKSQTNKKIQRKVVENGIKRVRQDEAIELMEEGENLGFGNIQEAQNAGAQKRTKKVCKEDHK